MTDMIVSELTQVAEYVAGKRIAFVANSATILDREHGHDIDASDIVLRMNAGLPDAGQHEALGTRTDILTIGNAVVYSAALRSFGAGAARPSLGWWMKNTPYGDRQWEQFTKSRLWKPPTWHFPKEWETLVVSRVGSPTSSGTLALWALVTHFEPKRIDVYGMGFFGALGSSKSWWHKVRAIPPGKHPHVGELEMAFICDIGFTVTGDETLTWTP